jgi:hypothetical protein
MDEYMKIKKAVIKSELTHNEKIALAIVSSGRSYDEASKVTGIDVKVVMDLWLEIVKKESKL